ncbi:MULTISPECIES: hypothetical protein [Enterobacterales]|uniref:hypothetical protein n=1 Tax=Enterobacterales TaxID=91347 RepID=UPI000D16F60A|nr:MULTISPECIES: hypothetical protein [Enterobacterales]ELI8277586.1 hypothetical protein [Yersinia enterocolitica]PTA95734.1 hypothetical protein C9415_09240 [Kluyvera sp. Nf5]AZP33354.1 hypothetical protein DC438_09520 [Cronobacter sakazakii]ELY2596329.1 hypothetical protein [Cronobacter sakazakii]ELY3982886.1 hypothetical protein [Cronobacter muytjensii]
MKINLALLSAQRRTEAEALSIQLECAMMAGDVSDADKLTQQLLRLAQPEPLLWVPETTWRRMLARVRETQSDFIAGFVLEEPQIAQLAQALSSPENDEALAAVAALMALARSTGSLLLQLPQAEEEEDV